MEAFTYKSIGAKVIFGKPLIPSLKEELKGGKSRNIGVIASKRNAPILEEISNFQEVDTLVHFDQVAQHVPDALVKEALDFFEKDKPDLILAVGGGSAIGLAKALVLERKMEFWAVPTTYSGSEMTNIYGISYQGKKVVKRDDRVHPHRIFYDPELSMGLPLGLAVPSAFNALAHLLEALYSVEKNPLIESMTEMGIKELLEGLKALSTRGKLDEATNRKLLFGAYVGGKVLSEVSMGLHHKTAHVLGGNFGLDHAKTHTLILPYVLKYQWPYLDSSIRSAFQLLFQDEQPYASILNLQQQMGVDFKLRDLGMKEDSLEEAVSYLMDMHYSNPAPLDTEKLLEMLKEAY
ncbi:maleylacetate reductase [Pararhodonellum marinum]|uniref:maleylacetate reductase n=1 Tax=Pararhodonellum marinum TaxID=2755358 RepID=UPI00189030EF|nr:maleylacetate reductase [Pararhodonellum marinum]